MNKQERDKLRELASKATPGPWSYDLDEQEIHADTYIEYGGDPYHIVHGDGSIAEKNAIFIAESNPETISKLLDDYEKLEEALKDIERTSPAVLTSFPSKDFAAERARQALKDVGALEP